MTYKKQSWLMGKVADFLEPRLPAIFRTLDRLSVKGLKLTKHGRESMAFFKIGELYQVKEETDEYEIGSYLDMPNAMFYQNYKELQEYTERFFDYPEKPEPYNAYYATSLTWVKRGDIFMVLSEDRRADIQNIINVLHNGQQKWLLVQNNLAIRPSMEFKQISNGNNK